jgi:type VI secretion system protein ImpL
VWEFQKANLDPFLRGLPGRGYEPRAIYGSAISFSPAFVNLLNRGRVGKDALSKSYAVRVEAIPTDANIDAVRKPEKTRLVVQCGSGNQELENYNFKITKTIQWSPQGCGDVTIEVYVGDIVLKHSYMGYRAFIQFLADFSSGRRVFRAADFPEHAGILAGYKVRTVTMAYTFSGHDGVLRLAGADPSSVPEKIVAD